jgi:RNA polymerase sigma-70 factor (ECF subfamily)
MAANEWLNEAELPAQLEALHAESFGWSLCCCARDRAQAEDVLQTAYLKVLEGRARFDGGAAFKTWLFGVIRRTALDVRRRAWRYYRWLVPLADCPDDALPAVETEAGSAIDHAETVARLCQGLAALPRRQREVLHLVFYQELSLSEAAVVMGVTIGTARTHYERGKKSLRHRLEKAKVFHEFGSAR